MILKSASIGPAIWGTLGLAMGTLVTYSLVARVDWEAFWTASAAIGQVVAALLAIFALIYSIHTFTKSIWISHYAELDKMYADLLGIAVENPHLRNPKATRTEEQTLQYDSYAYMVWNFLETIRDRIGPDRELLETWYPVMETENKLHRDWFDRQDNQGKFKQLFRDYIHETFPKPNETQTNCQDPA